MSQYASVDKHLLSSQMSDDNLDVDVLKSISYQSPNTSYITHKNDASLSQSIVDPSSRIELLEHNLLCIQRQHKVVLIDLHDEISRLRQENRGVHKFTKKSKLKINKFHCLDLHRQLTKSRSLSSTELNQTNTDSTTISISSKCIYGRELKPFSIELFTLIR